MNHVFFVPCLAAVVVLSSLPLLVKAQHVTGQPHAAGQPAPRVLTNSVGMRLAEIPAGAFEMGSQDRRLPKQKTLTPHRVQITTSFWIGTHEVTQGEYHRVLGSNPSQFSQAGGLRDRVRGVETDRLPVDSVSWHDAKEFCLRLTQLPAERQKGRSYRLPTEAEWEYACRGGSKKTWCYGNEVRTLRQYGWYRRRETMQRTHIVGERRSNRFGLYDMYGNVWEWCSDFYEAEYYSHSPLVDPQGPSQGFSRVIRGGGWDSPAGNCTNANRNSDPPQIADQDTGFRVVCEVK